MKPLKSMVFEKARRGYTPGLAAAVCTARGARQTREYVDRSQTDTCALQGKRSLGLTNTAFLSQASADSDNDGSDEWSQGDATRRDARDAHPALKPLQSIVFDRPGRGYTP